MPKTALKPKKSLPKYVYERDGKWMLRRYFPTGQRSKKGVVIYDQITRVVPEHTEECAHAVSAAIEALHNDISTVPAEGETLARFIEHYLIPKKTSVSRKRYEQIEDYLTRLLPPSLSALPIKAIGPMDIQRAYNLLPSSSSTIRVFHKILSTVFNQAVKWDVIAKNPTKGVILPSAKTPDRTSLTSVQAKKFLQECRKTDNNILFELLLETGLRPGEALALRRTDLDGLTLSITRALVTGIKGGGAHLGPPKTESSIRKITISPVLAARLKRQFEILDEMAVTLKKKIQEPILLPRMQRMGVKYKKRKQIRQNAREKLKNLTDLDLMFPSSTGGFRDVKNVNQRSFKSLIEKVSSKPLSPYTLRHTMATLSLAAGADIKTISKKLGHSDIATTLSHYAHVLDSMKTEATDRLSEALYGVP